ncbi:LTA synthase family protein [Bacillus sp. 2205SS5-2]|uniref:LTA synthase family protein n=1 Tax=Bacillus sp. 2205SS5-2 TaxID=3109031 RepID=UPI0030076ADD
MGNVKKIFYSITQDKMMVLSAVGLTLKIFMFYLFLGKNILEVKSLFVSVPGSIFVLFSFAFLLKTWSRKIFVISINILMTFLILAQLWYIRYFGTPLSFFALLQTSNLSGLGPSIFELIKVRDFIFIVDIIVLLLVAKKKEFSIKKNHIAYFIIFFLVGMSLLTFKPLKNHYVDGVPYAQIFKIYDRYDYLLAFNPIQYSALDLYITYKNNRYIELSVEEENEILEWFANKEKYREDRLYLNNKYEGIGKGKNLLFVQVESLENWVINKEIKNVPITPNLNSILEHSVYASNFYPQTKGGRSSDAEFILNTSLLPVNEGSTFFRYPRNEYTTLPDLLKEEGYSTFAFHGDEGTYWNRLESYPYLGIDEYHSIKDYSDGEEIGMGLSDIEFFNQTVDFLEDEEDPYYGLLITLTSHTPFEMPSEHKSLEFDSQYEKTSLSNYLQSISYADKAIGSLLDTLEKKEMLDDTLIVIYGDHAAFENNYKQQIMKENPTIEGVDQSGRVPFMIYNPSLEPLELTQTTGQLDIYPTLAYVMGIEEEKYENVVLGRNMLTTADSFSVLPLENKIISDRKMNQEKIDFEKNALQISDLIIRSNYFKRGN